MLPGGRLGPRLFPRALDQDKGDKILKGAGGGCGGCGDRTGGVVGMAVRAWQEPCGVEVPSVWTVSASAWVGSCAEVLQDVTTGKPKGHAGLLHFTVVCESPIASKYKV